VEGFPVDRHGAGGDDGGMGMSTGRRVVVAAVLAALALLETGCASYWKNRGYDLIDPFGFAWGVGLGASARATHFLQAGAGGFFQLETRPMGFCGRRGITRSGGDGEIGIAPFYYQRVHGSRGGSSKRGIVLGKTYLYIDRINSKDEEFWTYFPGRKQFQENYDRRLFDFGVTAILLLGFEVNFNPFEFLDLLLGFVGLDIAGDDLWDQIDEPAELTVLDREDIPFLMEVHS